MMEFHWKKEKPTARVDARLDFRLNLHQEQFRGTHKAAWWSVLIGLRDGSIDKFVEALGPDMAQDIMIPDDHNLEDRVAVDEIQHLSCFARARLLRVLNEGAFAPLVSSLALGMVVDEAHLAFDVRPQARPKPDISVSAGTVLTAVIDDGIAFAHNFFRSDLMRSRVAFANILATPTKEEEARTSAGRILDQTRIDRLLRQNTYCKLLDEEQFYRDVGLFGAYEGAISSTALSRSHGSHVMGLAAGYEMDAAPENRPILCALLPSLVTEDSTGQSLLPSLTLALKRLTRQAARFVLPNGKRPPVVFNFSYGNFSGPHDGTNAVELEFEKYFSDERDQLRRLVLPVGNGNLSQTHGQVRFDKGPHYLDLLVHPDDRTPSFTEMWMPYSGPSPLPALIEVTVTTPGGLTSEPVRVSGEYDQVLCDCDDKEVARLAYRFAEWPTERGVIVLSTRPTASLTSARLAPSGQWRIKMTPLDINPADCVEVWVARDETIPGFRPGGKQSYFNNPDYVRYGPLGAPLAVDPAKGDSPVRRAGIQSGITTGGTPLVVAGYAQSNRLLADYSAAGPITAVRGAAHASRCGPDAAAKSDASPALPGVLSAGTRSGSLVRMNGTSVAAPRVARLVVAAIAQGAPGDRKWLWEKAEATPYSPVKGEVPSETRTGGGQVDIPVSFDRE